MNQNSHESVSTNTTGKKTFSLVHLLYHLHPVRIPMAALDIKRTFGLGGMGVVLILILAFSGTLMLFVYKPLPQEAYGSVLLLQEAYLFGKFIRALHYFSANLLVIISLAHMLRVFFTQCFHAPRQFNWIIGLGIEIQLSERNCLK